MISLTIKKAQKMSAKRKLAGAIGAGAIFAASFLPVLAATEGSVTATVTVENIAVSVSDGDVTYGALAVNTSKDTTSGVLDDSQIVTNDGNVNETFNIRGKNSTSAGAGWTIAASAGSEQYVHEFCTAGGGSPDPCDATPSYTALTTGNQTLATPVAPAGTQKFDLKVTTPTATTDFNQQDVSVTIQASAS